MIYMMGKYVLPFGKWKILENMIKCVTKYLYPFNFFPYFVKLQAKAILLFEALE